MKRRKILLISTSVFLMLLLLASCGTEPTPKPITQAPVISATNSPTAAPTSTPFPSPTSQPTATPAPTPTPTVELTASEYFEQGVSLFEQDDFETAMVAFDRAITLDPWFPTTAFLYRHQARQIWEASQAWFDLDIEIADLDQVIAENPEDAEAYYQRASAKYSRTLLSGEPVERRPLFEESNNVNVVGGTITADSLSLEHAIADFNEVIALDPEFAAAYHMRGLAYHLQSLEYIGIALVDFDPEDIELAIRDYDEAIALDPELSVAYHDRGAALTLRSWLVDEADEEDRDPVEELNQAIGDFTIAIEENLKSSNLYINRAFAQMQMLLIDQQNDADEVDADTVQTMFDDASQAIALDPDQPWGYLFRFLAFSFVDTGTENQDLASEWEPIVDEDVETFERLMEDPAMQYELSDMFSRVLSLSQGPPIGPSSSTARSFGQFTDGRYTSPDGNLELEIPELMQPNAVIWDELTAGGDLLVWFEDDIARWFSMQVHPGTLEVTPLSEWVQENINQYLNVQEVYEVDTQNGPVVITAYRHIEPEGSCALAILYFDANFYSAEYCLLDHFMGEEEEFGSIRLFATSYGIDYEPVNTLLMGFLQGVEILDKPILTPASAVIEEGID